MSSDRRREPRSVRTPRLGLMLALAVVAVLMLAACGASTSLTAAVSSSVSGAQAVPDSTATATVGTTTIALPVSGTPASLKAAVRTGADAAVAPTSTQQGFLGVATELSTITALAGTPTNLDTPFVQLLKSLSPGAPFLLRLGGDSADWDWWAVPGMKQPLAIRYTMTPQWGQTVKALLSAVGAKAMFGVNLELDSKRVAAYEVKEYEQYIGSKLIYGFELGNEPELYGAFNYYHLKNGTGVLGRNSAQYTIDDYGKDFSNLATVLAGKPLLGPSVGSPKWLLSLGQILSHLPSRLKVATVHAYPLKHCSASAHLSVGDFFGAVQGPGSSIQGLADAIHAMVLEAGAQHKLVRVDEINGITCGGQAGVSNSFAEALWALNMLPALWRAGVDGVNMQDINGNLNQMITATDTSSGWHVSVQPEYYGLLAFANVAPARSHLLKLTSPAQPGFYEYAVKNPDGASRVVLTNVNATARTVGISVAGGRGPGVITRLTAPSLTATSGTTLGGQRIGPTSGQLSGAAAETEVKANARGVYAVRVPAHSAAILTVGS